jgi:L-fuconolactonase
VKIDAHHHFWAYSEAEYGWIDDTMATIRRDFLPSDLREATAAAGIDRVISVQARQSVEETEWLLGLAAGEELVAGVVGWLPLVAPDITAQLDRFAGRAKLAGLRHVLQGETEPGYMLREDFNRGLAALAGRGLAYDILVFERQLPEVLHLVDRHPHQRFILDHIAKPRIRARELQPWLDNMRELARRPNVWCKLSGVVTEADSRSWTEQGLRPYLEGALEAFGPRRLMFGSDWPVCLVATGYADWAALAGRFVSRLSETEQEAFWSGNAREAYRL